MSKTLYKGVEDARNQLPALVEDAAAGRPTVITKRGRPLAALVPLEVYTAGGGQQSLLPLEGTGRALWGKSSTRTLRKLRDEWNR